MVRDSGALLGRHLSIGPDLIDDAFLNICEVVTLKRKLVQSTRNYARMRHVACSMWWLLQINAMYPPPFLKCIALTKLCVCIEFVYLPSPQWELYFFEKAKLYRADLCKSRAVPWRDTTRHVNDADQWTISDIVRCSARGATTLTLPIARESPGYE